MTDYKQTLNLPETEFPMRGNLAKREPDMLASWEADDWYRQVQDAQSNRRKLYPTRRSSLRERRHPYRSRCQQSP